MEIVLFILIAANVIASILLYRKNNGRMALTSFLLTCLVPFAGIGIALMFRQSVFQKWASSYDHNEITERKQMKDLMVHPQINEELNIVPVSDAMAVSSSQAKRSMMLSQMKKDLTQNYRVLIGATSDKDSETAHYASALKMEIYSKHQIAVGQKQKEYQENASEENGLHCLEEIEAFIKSGLLSEYEKKLQEDQFCRLVEELGSEKLDSNLFETWIGILLEQHNYEQIEKLWQKNKQGKCSEHFLMKVLECSIEMKNRYLFEDLNTYIHLNPDVIVSAGVQKRVDFWNHWRQSHAFL